MFLYEQQQEQNNTITRFMATQQAYCCYVSVTQDADAFLT